MKNTFVTLFLVFAYLQCSLGYYAGNNFYNDDFQNYQMMGGQWYGPRSSMYGYRYQQMNQMYPQGGFWQNNRMQMASWNQRQQFNQNMYNPYYRQFSWNQGQQFNQNMYNPYFRQFSWNQGQQFNQNMYNSYFNQFNTKTSWTSSPWTNYQQSQWW